MSWRTRRAALRLKRVARFTETAPSWPPVRHPHQVYLMAGSLFSGLVSVLGLGTSRGVSEFLDNRLALAAWAFTLLLSGGCGIWAAVTVQRNTGVSLLVERVSLAMAVPGMAVFAAAVVVLAHWDGVPVAVMVGGYGYACGVRLRQVQESINWLHWLHEREGARH